ncbi:hypothetical protein RI367_002522 [Sorochytrium milnesiophthora]
MQRRGWLLIPLLAAALAMLAQTVHSSLAVRQAAGNGRSQCNGHGVAVTRKMCVCDIGWEGATCKKATPAPSLKRRATSATAKKTLAMFVDAFDTINADVSGAAESNKIIARHFIDNGFDVTVYVAPGADGKDISATTTNGISIQPAPQSKINYKAGPAMSASLAVHNYLTHLATPFDTVYFEANGGIGYYTLLYRQLGIACPTTHFVVGVSRPPLHAHKHEEEGDDVRKDVMRSKSIEYADMTFFASSALQGSLPGTVLSIADPQLEAVYHGSEQPTEVVYVGDLALESSLISFVDAMDNVHANPPASISSSISVVFLGTVRDVAGKSALEYIQRRTASWTRFHIEVRTSKMLAGPIISYLTEGSKLAVIGSIQGGASFLTQAIAASGVSVLLPNTVENQELIVAAGAANVFFPEGDAAALTKSLNAALVSTGTPAKLKTNVSALSSFYANAIRALGSSQPKCSTLKKATETVSILLTATREWEAADLTVALNALSSQSYKNVELIMMADENSRLNIAAIEAQLKQSKLTKHRLLDVAHLSELDKLQAGVDAAAGAYVLVLRVSDIVKGGSVETLTRVIGTLKADVVVAAADEVDGTTIKRSIPAASSAEHPLYNVLRGDVLIAARKALSQILSRASDSSQANKALQATTDHGFNVVVVPESVVWRSPADAPSGPLPAAKGILRLEIQARMAAFVGKRQVNNAHANHTHANYTHVHYSPFNYTHAHYSHANYSHANYSHANNTAPYFVASYYTLDNDRSPANNTASHYYHDHTHDHNHDHNHHDDHTNDHHNDHHNHNHNHDNNNDDYDGHYDYTNYHNYHNFHNHNDYTPAYNHDNYIDHNNHDDHDDHDDHYDYTNHHNYYYDLYNNNATTHHNHHYNYDHNYYNHYANHSAPHDYCQHNYHNHYNIDHKQSCDSDSSPLTIDLSSSVGTSLSYTFLYYGNNVNVSSVLAQSNGTINPFVVIPTKYIAIGATINMTIIGTDATGRTGNATYSVTKQNTVVPFLSIAEGGFITIAYTDQTSLSAVLRFPACASSSSTSGYSYSWTVTTATGVVLPYANSSINLLGATLGYGTAVGTVVVTGYGLTLTATSMVLVPATPLIAVMSGGSLGQIGVGSSASLSVTVLDLDKPTQTAYSYAWACAPVNQCPSFASTTGSSLQINSPGTGSVLFAGVTYTFTVYVSDPQQAGRGVTAQSTVVAIAGQPPTIKLFRSPQQQTIPATSDVLLYAAIASYGDSKPPYQVSYSWFVANSTANVSLAGITTSSNLFYLPGTRLVPGSSYSLQVNVTVNGVTAFAQASFATSSPPQGGYISVTNTDQPTLNNTGRASQDNFRLSTGSWMGTGTFLYSLGYTSSANLDTYIVAQTSMASVSNVLLPGDTVSVFAEAVDSSQVVVRRIVAVTMQAPQYSSQQLAAAQNASAAAMTSATNVFDLAKSFNAAQQLNSVAGNTVTAQAVASFQATALAAFATVLSATSGGRASSASIALISASVSSLDITAAPANVVSQALSIAITLVNPNLPPVAIALTDAIHIASIASGAAINLASTTTSAHFKRQVSSSTTAETQSRTIVQGVARGLVAGDSCQLPGPTRNIVQSAFALQARRVTSDGTTVTDSSRTVGNFTLQAPAGLPQGCYDVQFVNWNVPMRGSAAAGTNITSSVLTVQMYLNTALQAVTSPSLTLQYNATVAPYNVNTQTPSCVYYDGSVWRSDNCITTPINSTAVSCQCPGYSDFAVKMQAVQAAPPPSAPSSSATATGVPTAAPSSSAGAIVGGVIGSAAIVGAGFGFMKWHQIRTARAAAAGANAAAAH